MKLNEESKKREGTETPPTAADSALFGKIREAKRLPYNGDFEFVRKRTTGDS